MTHELAVAAADRAAHFRSPILFSETLIKQATISNATCTAGCKFHAVRHADDTSGTPDLIGMHITCYITWWNCKKEYDRLCSWWIKRWWQYGIDARSSKDDSQPQAISGTMRAHVNLRSAPERRWCVMLWNDACDPKNSLGRCSSMRRMTHLPWCQWYAWPDGPPEDVLYR